MKNYLECLGTFFLNTSLQSLTSVTSFSSIKKTPLFYTLFFNFITIAVPIEFLFIILYLSLQINVLITEPYFVNSVRPWELMCFAYIRRLLNPFLAPEVSVVPQIGKLKAVAVDFDDLWKIRAPVKSAEGFDLSKFDEMVQVCCNVLKLLFYIILCMILVLHKFYKKNYRLFLVMPF